MPGNFSSQNLAHFVQELLQSSAKPYLRSGNLTEGASTPLGPQVQQLLASAFVQRLAEDTREKLVLLRTNDQRPEVEAAFLAVAELENISCYYMDLPDNEVPPEYEKILGIASNI